jgi:hypothetical protein
MSCTTVGKYEFAGLALNSAFWAAVATSDKHRVSAAADNILDVANPDPLPQTISATPVIATRTTLLGRIIAMAAMAINKATARSVPTLTRASSLSADPQIKKISERKLQRIMSFINSPARAIKQQQMSVHRTM